MRVLVGEDEPRLAESIASGLREGSGYAVDVAHHGQDAIHLCRTVDYDLIVLDLKIPRFSVGHPSACGSIAGRLG